MAVNATSTELKDALREFLDQLNTPAPAFSMLEDFNADSTSEAPSIRYDLPDCVSTEYQYTSFILSLLTATVLGHVLC